MNLSDTEKAYIAGIIDGEGSLSIGNMRSNVRKRIANFKPVIRVAVTNPDLPLYLKEKIGGGITIVEHKTVNLKTQYAWYISGKKNIVVLLQLLMPYLIIKKKQAQLFLEYFKTTYNYERRNLITGQFNPIPKSVIKRRLEISNLIKCTNRGGQDAAHEGVE